MAIADKPTQLSEQVLESVKAGSGFCWPANKTSVWVGALSPQAERRLQVVPAVGAECDEGMRFQNAWNLVQAPGDDVVEVVVVADADHRDEIDLTGD